MFNKPSHYFFNITFDWPEVLKLLGAEESKLSDFEISPEYHFRTPNGNTGGDEMGMNSQDAFFEYYIMPHVIGRDSSIYDTQLKRFFSTLNLRYENVLTCKDKNFSILCWLERRFSGDKSAFSVGLHDNEKSSLSTITFVFPEEVFNRKNADYNWGRVETVTAFTTKMEFMGDPVVQKLQTLPESLFINLGVQSEHDAQSGPGFHREVSKHL